MKIDYFRDFVRHHNLSFDHKAYVFGKNCESTALRTPLQMEFRRHKRTIHATITNLRCDAFNNVDLVLSKDLFRALKDVTLYIGGQRFDSMHFGEAYNPFVHDANDRHIAFPTDDTVVIPLVMAGLTSNCFLIPLEHHETYFLLRFADDTLLPGEGLADLVGFLADCYKFPGCRAPSNYHMIVRQTEYWGPDGPFGNGEHTVRLCFRHCLISIAFHGIHPKYVEHVKLRSVTDGVESLAYDGIPIRICEDGQSPYVIIDLHGTVNASLVDELYLDFSVAGLPENETRAVHVHARNYEIAAFRDGMAGLVFTG